MVRLSSETAASHGQASGVGEWTVDSTSGAWHQTMLSSPGSDCVLMTMGLVREWRMMLGGSMDVSWRAPSRLVRTGWSGQAGQGNTQQGRLIRTGWSGQYPAGQTGQDRLVRAASKLAKVSSDRQNCLSCTGWCVAVWSASCCQALPLVCRCTAPIPCERAV